MATDHTVAARFETLTERVLDDYFETMPQFAARLGLHDYDGRVSDFSAEALDRWAARLRGYMSELDEIDAAGLDPDGAMDHAQLTLAVEEALFSLTELRQYRRNPMDYLWALDTSTYVKRDYAPLADRMAALGRHLAEVPRVLRQAEANLEMPVPETFVSTAIGMYRGLAEHLRSGLEPSLSALREDEDSEAQLAEIAVAQADAVSAVEDYLEFLAAIQERGDITPDFAIGEAAYREMLRTGEALEVDLERLIEIGEEDLERNQTALAAMARAIDPDAEPADIMAEMDKDHPRAEDLVEATREMLDELRDWTLEHDLVTVPEGGELLVEETPGYLRWAFAMLSSPGPFEVQDSASYYYVTPPEPDWEPERRAEWLTKFAYPKLLDVSIHEAYPGHFVHFLHFRRVPSRVRQIFSAYSFWEAWAHYSEQLMIEAGYRPDDLHLRLAQLSEALLRNVRYLASIKMHTQGMTVDEAAKMFETEAYMAPAPARQEAVRGTFDPGYLNYTLGKLMLLRLRDDYRDRKKEQDETFSLKEFHDAFLSFGAPPIPLVRQRLLGDADAL